MNKTGGCLCGAVRYEVTDAPTEIGACHCGMCRKFSGGINVAMIAPPGSMTVTGAPKGYASSEWARRCFCPDCGASLWYEVTLSGPQQGTRYVGVGTLDDPSGLTLAQEIFIDRKPDAYAFVGEHQTMTEAEFMAMYASPH